MSSRAGLAQHQRLPAALAPHYIDIDELSVDQLLALALEYAGMVRFAESGTDPAGWDSWHPYFASDESMVMADIMTTRLQGAKAGFDQLLDQLLTSGADEERLVARGEVPTWLLYQQIVRLQRWSQALVAHGSASGVDLGALIGELHLRLEPAMRIVEPLHNGQGQNAEQMALAPLLRQLAGSLRLDSGSAAAAAYIRTTLRTWWHQAIKGVEMAQRGAAARLRQSLVSGTHDPGTGVLLAFVQLYRQAQHKINRLGERHLDFYYDRVLHMRERRAERDATFLVFDPVLPGTGVEIAAGTVFLAPFDKLQPELHFASEHRAVVTDARVRQVFTLFCERNRRSSPENGLSETRNGLERTYPSACRITSVDVAAPADVLDVRQLASHPLFGAPRPGASALPGEAARIGFALASNVLLMQEGERVVRVSLALGTAADSERSAEGATLGERLASLARELKVEKAEANYKVLRRMFKVSISGAAGWIAFSEYSAEFTPGPGDACTLDLYFRLGADAAAVVPYLPAVHGDGYAGHVPLMRFELNGEGYLYPYGLLRGLPLLAATINVSVTGLRTLVLQNHIGPLSPAAPFLPFGPLPAVGSYLIAGSAETACKRLSRASLVLEWGGLPSVAGGFRTWYAGYGSDTPFSSVQCNLSVLVDGRWQPPHAEARASHTLFAPDRSEAWAIAAREEVDLGPLVPLARPLPPATEERPFAYTSSATGGFFKLSLSGPPFLFGHADYPYALAAALTHNSRPGWRRQLHDLPNPPYAPLLDSVAMNYQASATVTAAPSRAGEALLRLHPRGWELAQGGVEGGDLLLPPIDYSGNLFIGISASQIDSALTLYFHLVEDAMPMGTSGQRHLQWSYLADNQWLALPPHAVRADSTRAFLRPGIVTLKLPADINRNNTVMPPELYWLRLSCESDLEKFCSLYSVHTNAVQVWRREQVAGAGAPVVVAAKTIRRPLHAIPGLGGITQMIASFGGRPAEDRMQLRRRTAERLKHKGRALTPDDYERMILQQFPALDRVKCFPNLSLRRDPAGGACPGHVLIIGLPPHVSRGHLLHFPRLNGDLIAQITEWLGAHVSPAVTFEVANPVYQHLQVRCTVRLVPGADEGACVNALDQLISDFISPWSSAGNTRHFGWRIRQHDIESLILAQPYVMSVGQFSMLSVSDEDEDDFQLGDSAVPGSLPHRETDVVALQPWAIAVPNRRHAIVVDGSDQLAPPMQTGIGKLEIGDTFIL